jgi:hypothetical protein
MDVHPTESFDRLGTGHLVGEDGDAFDARIPCKVVRQVCSIVGDARQGWREGAHSTDVH